MNEETEKQVKLILHPHLYAEEKLADWSFDNMEFYWFLGADIFGALWNHLEFQTIFSYDEKTTVGDTLNYITNTLIEYIPDDDDHSCFLFLFYCIFFLGPSDRYYPENFQANFKNLLEKYFDPNKTGVVNVEILVNVDAGNVWEENRLRFDMHSHEGNRHNEPHVHVLDKQSGNTATIAISNQAVLGGALCGKLLKQAKRTIREKQEYFYRCWNEKTDGIVVDINRHFGLIGY